MLHNIFFYEIRMTGHTDFEEISPLRGLFLSVMRLYRPANEQRCVYSIEAEQDGYQVLEMKADFSPLHPPFCPYGNY